MSGDGDEVPRLLRDRHIKAVRDTFHRPPTVSELRAIDSLPLEPRKNLNDTSPNGQRIYELLRAFEKTGYIEGLEEAGRLIWAQIFAEPDLSHEPRRKPFSAVRSLASREINKVEYKASQHPTRTPKEKPLQRTSEEKVIAINATSNAFAGSPQKPWMTKGISISPTTRRASISSVESSNNNEPANYHIQSPELQPVSSQIAQSGQQTQNHTSKFTTAVPGGLPNTCGGGVYMPLALHQKVQEHQYASPYSVQASETSMPYVSEGGEPARDMISRANIPSIIDGELRVPSESTDCSALMGNSLHTLVSHKSYPSAPSKTYRFEQTTSPNSTHQHSPRGHQNSMMSSSGNHSRYYPLPSTNQNPLQPLNGRGYQNLQIPSSTDRTYDPTSPPFHPAISAEGQQIPSSTGRIYDPTSPSFHPAISAEGQRLFLSRNEEEENELAHITSNTHHSLSKLPDNQGDQQTESSSTVVAANDLSSISTTGHRTELATPNPSMQQSPSFDTSAMAPGQSNNNPFVIRDDMGFIPLSSQEITDQDLNFAPDNPLPISSRRITRSVSRSTTTPTSPTPKTTKAKTTLLHGAGPQFGILIPETPPPGTIFSTRTQNALSVHNAKKSSTKKAFIPTASGSAQADGASDSASKTNVQAHYIPDLPPQRQAIYSSASSDPSIEFIHFDPMNDYDKDDDAYTGQPTCAIASNRTHLHQAPHSLFHRTPTHPSPPPPHLRPHTPEYLLFPPVAASSSKQTWPPPPPELEGFRQYTFVRDRISLNMKAKRRTEVDLDTGEYRYSMDSKETSRGYKMDGTRIRTSSRYFHKKRVAKKSKEKVEEERLDEIVRKVESVEKGVNDLRREEGEALLALLGGGFLPL
ncbi:uncharacterized protein EAF01_003249 [Botrytis porri]|uniref:Uncharacterized protein n=1 Tax=Botrytis porri TaxID=87229 RepID=A0A4Z1KRT0_9HELO|nr:uncharacterized protein EAF01_003249 [Botrytis porri]KAF7909531.1 hypothetical protein EAF01_003249 [Botrytis porri]TGO87264.1 hypothetical protein BPOR_0237g00030 [Botrytis porri]